ncbi:hypothetical protein GCM10027570_54970 [Streptomonospora sediminis]
MSPADDHPDPQKRGAPPPRPDVWLDAYVHHRLAALDPDLDGVQDPDPDPDPGSGPDPGGARVPPEPPPPVPEVTAEELAEHLAHLAEHYRRRQERGH